MPGLGDILRCRNSDEKLGLALSGGGFRAAFFHVGVLARLAEIGLLPRVEVISTVSGGSIVGALYYLCLKRRLESMPEGGIGRDGYLELVAEVEALLRRGAQRNIRTRTFANPLKNAKMVLSPRYSRSDRIGDLYDRYIYKDAWGEQRERRWKGHGPELPVALRELKISPRCEPVEDPAAYNASHDEKLPILLLNATSLNSGHNWRFEAVRMGESLPVDERRAKIANSVDKSMRLLPGYFDPCRGWPQVPPAKRDFPLAKAVAASAAVPGVFQPLPISGMYEGIRVQLVDGGVQDNQGLQGLLDSGCDQLIVSDASGQMPDREHPSSRLFGVLARSGSIEGDRIRDEQLLELLDREGERALVHLRLGLDGRAIPPGSAPPRAEAKADGATADFGVDADAQDALSQIRTDLDFFSDTEASALELDAYLMSGRTLEASGLAGAEVAAREHPGWAFRAGELEDRMRRGDPRLVSALEAGKHMFLRWLARLPAAARWAIRGIALLALAAIVIAFILHRDLFDTNLSTAVALPAVVAALILLAFYVTNPRSLFFRVLLTPPLFLVALPLAALAALAAIPVFLLVTLGDWTRKSI